MIKISFLYNFNSSSFDCYLLFFYYFLNLFFYLSYLIPVLLIIFILFEIIYEIRYFFQFHSPSTFLFIRFGPYYFNKFKKIKKLKSYYLPNFL